MGTSLSLRSVHPQSVARWQRSERGAKEKSDFVQGVDSLTGDKLSALEGQVTTQSTCEGPIVSGPGGKNFSGSGRKLSLPVGTRRSVFLQ